MREAPSRYTHPETPFGPQQQRFDSINAKLAGYSQFGCNHQILATCNKKAAGIRACRGMSPEVRERIYGRGTATAIGKKPISFGG